MANPPKPSISALIKQQISSIRRGKEITAASEKVHDVKLPICQIPVVDTVNRQRRDSHHDRGTQHSQTLESYDFDDDASEEEFFDAQEAMARSQSWSKSSNGISRIPNIDDSGTTRYIPTLSPKLELYIPTVEAKSDTPRHFSFQEKTRPVLEISTNVHGLVIGKDRSATSLKPKPETNPKAPRASSPSSNVRKIPTATPSLGPQPSTSIRYATFCEVCEGREGDVLFCNVCTSSFCSSCWTTQVAHSRGKRGPGGIPHEPTKPDVAAKVHNALAPPMDENTREQLCRDDECTSWFGIERSDSCGPPIFQDYGRFADLMEETDPHNNGSTSAFTVDATRLGRDTRTPSLVSFVGQTGAGKSTLIKLLIDLASNSNRYETPVIGATGAHRPTSEDVHLYLDPRSAEGPSPILYADCEGLEGGEREPVGAQYKRKRAIQTKHETRLGGRFSRALKIISERELSWADAPRTQSREFAVTNLYPRLLYTFSDVIVFVLRNPRVVEHVFEKLVEWAAAALETSSNQPILPHAVIVLNASENDIDPELWDVNTNTCTILDDLASTLNRNETFKKCSQFWRERGRTIDTLEQLILSYYGSVQILRIPADGRPKLMQEQVEQLSSAIWTAGIAARAKKKDLRMLLDVEELQSYLEYAFNHFSGSLEFPFDFVQASFMKSPIPPDFGGNILKLAINLMEVFQANCDPSQIFQALSFIIASCIMFVSARHGIKGTAEHIFPKYIEHIDAALNNFCYHHWPCEYVVAGKGRCVNVRSGHTSSKGHQLKDGSVFGSGPYVSKFSFRTYHTKFQNQIYHYLKLFLDELEKRTSPAESQAQAAADIHREMALVKFYGKYVEGDNISRLFNSNTACYCCLIEYPEHPLPCGHVLCTSCIKMYGILRGDTEVQMLECPLERFSAWPHHSWKIRFRPESAGVRVLTLDGGGIRGIAELESLRAIERALDVSIPIQNFFDLIVGTSTGGLITLGLGAMNWSVDECINNFEMLCRKAFTRRTMSNLPLLGSVVQTYHNHSKYETKPLERVLQKAFSSNEYLFGGTKKNGSDVAYGLKVAVTATSSSGRGSAIFTNYNRSSSDKRKALYHFQRPERQSAEIKIWEAARATSAAPRFFRPFTHAGTQKTYVDGAIYHNNPIDVAESERKLIWPEIEEDYPDIILSLGTAFSTKLHRAESEGTKAHRGIFASGLAITNLLRNFVSTSIECERLWGNFLANLPATVDFSRFVRLNPLLTGDVPKLDDVDKMESLQKTVRRKAEFTKHRRIALQLVATTFYFQATLPIDADGCFASGRILCRIPDGSAEISELGRLFQRYLDAGVTPYFVVAEENKIAKSEDFHPITPPIVDKMCRFCHFRTPPLSTKIASRSVRTEIYLKLEESEIFRISGFPRNLLQGKRENKDPYRRISSNPNRWAAGASIRRKTKQSKWKAPTLDADAAINSPNTLITPSLNITRQAPMLQPMNQADFGLETTNMLLALPTTPGGGDVSPSNAEPNPGAASFFRNAFRALVRPVRPRPMDPNQAVEGVYELEAKEVDIYNSWLDRLSINRPFPNTESGDAPGVRVTAQMVGFDGHRGLVELDGDSIYRAELPGDIPSIKEDDSGELTYR